MQYLPRFYLILPERGRAFFIPPALNRRLASFDFRTLSSAEPSAKYQGLQLLRRNGVYISTRLYGDINTFGMSICSPMANSIFARRASNRYISQCSRNSICCLTATSVGCAVTQRHFTRVAVGNAYRARSAISSALAPYRVLLHYIERRIKRRIYSMRAHRGRGGTSCFFAKRAKARGAICTHSLECEHSDSLRLIFGRSALLSLSLSVKPVVLALEEVHGVIRADDARVDSVVVLACEVVRREIGRNEG